MSAFSALFSFIRFGGVESQTEEKRRSSHNFKNSPYCRVRPCAVRFSQVVCAPSAAPRPAFLRQLRWMHPRRLCNVNNFCKNLANNRGVGGVSEVPREGTQLAGHPKSDLWRVLYMQTRIPLSDISIWDAVSVGWCLSIFQDPRL